MTYQAPTFSAGPITIQQGFVQPGVPFIRSINVTPPSLVMIDGSGTDQTAGFELTEHTDTTNSGTVDIGVLPTTPAGNYYLGLLQNGTVENWLEVIVEPTPVENDTWAVSGVTLPPATPYVPPASTSGTSAAAS